MINRNITLVQVLLDTNNEVTRVNRYMYVYESLVTIFATIFDQLR